MTITCGRRDVHMYTCGGRGVHMYTCGGRDVHVYTCGGRDVVNSELTTTNFSIIERRHNN